jgi:hypothetical protein
MRILPLLAALATAATLGACTDEASCTPEEAQKKSADLAAKVTEIGTADPAKLAELTPKLQELTAKAAGTGDDLAAACKAMDEMMAELAK